MLCLFLSHLFSLFFQKRKSSSSVQLMVSVCRLPNTGKCWASDPCSLAPASLLQAAQEPRAGESVLRACVVRAHCVTICVLCVCVVCVFLLTPPIPWPRPAGQQQIQGLPPVQRWIRTKSSPWLLASPTPLLKSSSQGLVCAVVGC